MDSPSSTSDNVEEKTEVIYGAESIINHALNIISVLKKSVDNCTDSNGPSMFVIPNHESKSNALLCGIFSIFPSFSWQCQYQIAVNAFQNSHHHTTRV